MVAGPTSTALRMEPASAICPSPGAIARWMGATTAPARDPFASVSLTKSTPPEPAASLLAPLLAPSEPVAALQTPSTNAAAAANACPMSCAWSAGRALPLLNHTRAVCRVRQSVATALTNAVTMATAGEATSVKRPTRSGAWPFCPTPATAMRPSSVLQRSSKESLALEAEENVRGRLISRRERVLLELPGRCPAEVGHPQGLQLLARKNAGLVKREVH
jgi:hypothetical protein